MKRVLFYFVVALFLVSCSGYHRLQKRSPLVTAPTNLSLATDNLDNPVTDVNFDLNVPKKYVPKRSQLIYQPQFINGNMVSDLTPVVINGKKRAKKEARVEKRGKEINYPNAIRVVADKEPANVDYNLSVPVEEWMPESELVAWSSYSNMRGDKTTLNRTTLAEGVVMPTPKEVKEEPKSITRQVKQSEEKVSKLYFVINGSSFDAMLDKNSENLSSLKSLLSQIKNDSNLTLKNITVIGSASPDGTASLNEKLSKQRAETVATMIEDECHVSSSMMDVKWLGANWDGFKTLVEASSISDKGKILSIASMNVSDINRTVMLRRLPSFNTLKTTILPQLRKVACEVYYIKTSMVTVTE